MKNKIFLLLILLSLTLIVFADTPTDFSVSPTSIIMNITNPTANIIISNLTTEPSNLTIDNTTVLLDSLNREMNIIVYNSTHNSTFLNLTQETTITLYSNMSKPAGRYLGSIVIYNQTTPSNNISIPITVDVPITFINNIGNFSGNTSNTTENIFYFNASKNIIELNITFIDLSDNVSITLKDSENSIIKNITTPGDLYYSFIKNETNFGGDNKFWIIEIKGLTDTYAQYNGSIIISNPNFIFNNMLLNITQFNFIKNLGQAKNFTFQINISNNANYNLTIINITNSSGKVILSSDSSKYFNLYFDSLTFPYNITPNSELNLNVSINTTDTSNTKGEYYGWIFINTSNGYPYNTVNATLKVLVTDELNLTILNFTKKDTDENPTPSDNITIKVNVTYKDGEWTGYTDNGQRTFIAWLEHKENSNYKRNCTIYSQDTSDHYKFYCNISNTTAGGNYILYVRVNDTNNNVGIGSKEVIINETGISINADPIEIANNKDETESIDIIVKNIGYKNATKIVLSSSIGSCAQIVSTNSTYINSNGFNLTPGEEIRIKNAYKIKLKNPGDCVFTVYGYKLNNSESNTFYFVKNASVAIIVNEVSEEEQDQSSGGGYSANLLITDYPSQILIEQGQTYNAIIRVKNTGNLSLLNVKVWVLNISSSWWVQPEPQNIPYGQEITFNVQFNIPKTANAGTYYIKFIANTTGVSTSASSVLKVLPKLEGNETKNITVDELKEKLTNYTKLYESLKLTLDELKSKGKNITSYEEILNEIEQMLSKADAYLKLENISEAEKILSEISTRLSSVKEKIDEIAEEVKQSEISNYITVGIITLVITGIIIVIYLFIPRKSGYIPGVGYRHVTHETKFKELLHKLKEKFKKKKSYEYKP
ncbi:MAG: hypothetical protein QW469_03570 [Candidatus Aenigmatarchaeota archaeon]